MTQRLRAGAPQRGADGVRITADPRVRKQPWLLVAAIAVAVLALLALARLFAPPPPPAPPRAKVAGAPAADDRADAPAPRAGASIRVAARPRRVSGEAPPTSPPPASGASAPEAGAAGLPPGHDTSPTHEEPPYTVGPPGTGIDVFPKPGTDPIKIGIVVPEAFELPEGYVRHFQVTDDGRPLEPILMFHPDYEFLDERGRPVPLPKDLVVPPELAPPGLPIQMLELPPPPSEADEAP